MCSGDEYIIWEVTAHSGMTEPEARAAGARMREAGLALPMEWMKNISMEIYYPELIFLN